MRAGVKAPALIYKNYFIEHVINFYKRYLVFNDFYNLILNNIKSNSNEYIQISNFLEGISSYSKPFTVENIKIVNVDDYRIDMPVWFGIIQKAKNRIIVLDCSQGTNVICKEIFG